MAYDEFLAERAARFFRDNKASFETKKMMGGLTFMVNGKMCAGVLRSDLMIRVDPESVAALLKRKGCRVMDFTHKPMKGFLFIGAEGTDREQDLEFWLALALDYNPKAKASKK